MSPVMAVLVDELRECPHVRWTVKHWCHMVSDESFEELHAFAAALGIPRERFQRDHYDLPPHLRERAVARGAVAPRPAGGGGGGGGGAGAAPAADPGPARRSQPRAPGRARGCLDFATC